ncbi:MAG TPA: FRG domain-containing protein [Jatrophihabitans sp.]|uniref:FRG domain-containing protein n=1 Tax=Jatrophihabitans sp. TaxID=1932789 RepID=UPI002EFC0AF3
MWSRAGVQVRAASVSALLADVANITVATGHRYVWRGIKDATYRLDSALARRLMASKVDLTASNLARSEARLVQSARDARLDQGLSSAELLALLQHAGASTSLLDVTPDPFIALFFATEPVGALKPCALMAIRVPGATPARQAAHTFKGPLPDNGSSGSVFTRLREEQKLPRTTRPILWEAPFLDNRMRAQRGMFLATTAPRSDMEYGSIDLGLEAKEVEIDSVHHLLNRDRGQYRRPPLVVFYIPTALRSQVATELDSRFGYRTETVYPDLAGFALANSPNRVLE